MTSNVVPADDDLVERLLTNALYLRKHEDGICRLEANCLDEAASRLASLSSELALCRNALEEEPTEAEIEACVSFIYGLDHNLGETSERRADLETLREDLRDMLKAMRSAALNPIGEEGAREP